MSHLQRLHIRGQSNNTWHSRDLRGWGSTKGHVSYFLIISQFEVQKCKCKISYLKIQNVTWGSEKYHVLFEWLLVNIGSIVINNISTKAWITEFSEWSKCYVLVTFGIALGTKPAFLSNKCKYRKLEHFVRKR